MVEKISKKRLRELTLWGQEEPHELNEGMITEFRKLVTNWVPRELNAQEQEKQVPIPEITLTQKQIGKLEKIVGKNNLVLGGEQRVLNSHGGAGEDLVRVRSGSFSLLAEAVVHPETEAQIAELMSFCENNKLSLIPIGGRTGVTRATHLEKPGIILDLRPHFTKVLTVDKEQQFVTVQAGILGPELEKELAHEGLTLSHFPQSWEQSTVGGWIASRSAGQNSTLVGKIEDMVINLRICTPKGVIQSHLSPSRATGPQWFRYFIGSEGTLGIITQATLKVRPDYSKNRAFASFMFSSFEQGIAAMKEINQGEFLPAIGRLSDGIETQAYLLLNREGKVRLKDRLIDTVLKLVKLYPQKRAVFLCVYEGSKSYVRQAKQAVRRITRKYKALPAGGNYAQTWFKDRFDHPHLRDELLDLGLIVDTMETACTWEKIPQIYDAVNTAVQSHSSLTLAHLSHSYPSGSALYFTFFMPLKDDQGIEQIRSLQRTVLTAVQDHGGVVSHHHGIGKAFKKWAEQEWGKEALEVAQRIKEELDPHHILNPGNFPA